MSASVHDPIAIVGAACRLPGAATVAEFWNVLVNGRDTVAALPVGRRSANLGDTVPDGGFLDRIDAFDAPFFDMSPHEAARLDPHHRLLLETVWEAMEDAGLSADQLAGSRTGVYTSCFTSHYWNMLAGAGMHDMHAVLGAHRWAVPAGRISHLLDLRGPSIGAESTCASSLVAVHLACQAIRHGEVDAAVVGGVNLLLTHGDRTGMTEAGLLSPTFRCRFGDEGADGYVPAEGAVTIILKPLSAAVAAGDRVYATIIGSGVNSNGRQAGSAGGTGEAGQVSLLRIAFESAGITPSDVDYIEAHGPGTALGDAVELTALGQVMAGARTGRPCLVGSAKSNVGHTEAAAGLVGLLKTALAVHHRTVPGTLHVRNPNAALDAGHDVELARTTQPWPDRGRPAVAGVTALGLFGTGAHVVLSEAPASVRPEQTPGPGRAHLLTLSTKDPAALRSLASAYADTLASSPRPSDICFSAGARRTHLPHRLAVVGSDRDALVTALRGIAHGPPARPRAGVPAQPPRVAFVFSGQGSQWHGMALDLLTASPHFARLMRECDAAVRAEAGWSLLDRLHGDELRADREIQPTLWAIQVSLAGLFQHVGIEPAVVIGHSMGEVAAATVAGALSLQDGAAVVCRRSTLVGTLDRPGAMVAVRLGEHEATEAIGEYADRVSVAVVNSAEATVLAGDPDALAAVVEPLRRRGVHCRAVRAGYASHSPSVEPLRAGLVDALADLRPEPGRIPVHSTAVDRVVPGDQLDAEYWMTNLREPVRFASAVAAVAATGPTLFVEISPHPMLVGAVEDVIAEHRADATVVPSLHRNAPEWQALLTALGAIYVRGHAPEWSNLHRHGRFVPLPSYPWRRTRFWVDTPRAEVVQVPAPRSGDRHPATRSVAALTEHLTRQVAAALGTGADAIDPAVPLTLAGLDSLLAGRLRTTLEHDLDRPVSMGDLLGPRPLAEVATLLYAA